MKLEMNLLQGTCGKKMVNIDPKVQPPNIWKEKKKILGLIPGSKVIEKFINIIFLRLIHQIKYFGYISLKLICMKKMKDDHKITFIRGTNSIWEFC